MSGRNDTHAPKCHACGEPILDEYMHEWHGLAFHESCLREVLMYELEEVVALSKTDTVYWE